MPRPPDIARFVYVSNATGPCDGDAIQRILQISRRNNRRLDVTGCLLFSGSFFAQVLEGRHDAVAPLVERITADSRHADVRVLAESRSGERSYGEWSMGFFHDAGLEDELRRLLHGERPDPGVVNAILARMRPDTVLGGLQ